MIISVSTVLMAATLSSSPQQYSNSVQQDASVHSLEAPTKILSFADKLRAAGVLTLAKEEAKIGVTCGDMGCG
jgi:hypothetical protein